MSSIEVNNYLCEVIGEIHASGVSCIEDFLGDCPDATSSSLHKSAGVVDDSR